MADSPHTSVNLIRCFEGPRHSTLEFLWDAVAEYCADDVRLNVFPNPRAVRSHAACLNEIWEEELKRSERYAILTEFDFLPELRGKDWIEPCELTAEYPVIAANYCVRGHKTMQLNEVPDVAGAWYIKVDKEHVQELDFSPAGKFNDPANGLVKYVQRRYGKNLFLMVQRDCYPRHYGTQMIAGTHLFWSRHLHDDPMRHVAGVQLGDMQNKHDRAVRDWLREAPRPFQKLVTRRARKTVEAGRHAVGACPASHPN